MNAKIVSILGKAAMITAMVMLVNAAGIAQDNSQLDSGSGSPAAAPVIPDVFQSFTFSGTLDGSESTRPERLNRNGVVHSCAVPKTCDIFTTGSFPYDTYTFTNPDCSNIVCIDAVLRATCTDGNLDYTIYDGSFDPSDICANWIADPGFSTGTPAADLPMSFEVAPQQTIVIVVSTPNSGGTCVAGGGYELTLSGDFDLTPCAVVPTMGEWGLISLGMLLMIFGVVAVGQRKTSIA